jgi:hypothetical protein
LARTWRFGLGRAPGPVQAQRFGEDLFAGAALRLLDPAVFAVHRTQALCVTRR